MADITQRRTLGYSEGREDGYREGLEDGSRLNLVIGALIAGPTGLVLGWLATLLLKIQGC